MATFKHYIQEWKGYKRIIIVANEGSCFIDINDSAPVEYNDKVRIWGLNICPQYRHKGYGKQLLNYAENLLKQLREPIVSIEWTIHSPKWVLSWYQNSGYEVKINLYDANIILTKRLITENK